jgi:DNA-binding NarL/FixJ family response regulator
MIRVMIVDDHDFLREAIHLALQGVSDIDVVGVASDGLQALETADNTALDAVLMDLAMPRLDGIEATRRLLAQHPHIHVVAWTTAGGSLLADAARAAGAATVLYKDSDLDEVIHAIRSAGKSTG